MNKFCGESLDIKGLRLEDLSGNSDIKELGVKEIANGAGISEVGTTAVEDEGKTQVLEIILYVVVGFVIVVAVILACVILGIYLHNQKKKQKEFNIQLTYEGLDMPLTIVMNSKGPVAPKVAKPKTVRELTTELRDVLDKLNDCKNKKNKLKTAVGACNQELQDIKTQGNNVLTMVSNLNDISNGLTENTQNKGSLEAALANVNQKLQALDELEKEKLKEKNLNNLSRALEEFDQSQIVLDMALRDADIRKDNIRNDPNNSNDYFVLDIVNNRCIKLSNDFVADLNKYTRLNNEELGVLVEQFANNKVFLVEIYNNLKIENEGNDFIISSDEDTPVNVKEILECLSTARKNLKGEINEDTPISVKEVLKGLSTARKNLNDEINGAKAKATKLKEDISQKWVAVEKKKIERKIESVLQELRVTCEKYELDNDEKLTDENLLNLLSNINNKFADIADEKYIEYTNLNNEIKAQCEAIADNEQKIEDLFQLIVFLRSLENGHLNLNSDENLSIMFHELTASSKKLAENINELEKLKNRLNAIIDDGIKNAAGAEVISLLTFDVESKITQTAQPDYSLSPQPLVALLNDFLEAPENKKIKENFDHLVTFAEKIKDNKQIKYLRTHKKLHENERAANLDEYLDSVSCIADVANNYQTNYLPRINSRLNGFNLWELTDTGKTIDSLKEEIATQIMNYANTQITTYLRGTTLETVLQDVKMTTQTLDELRQTCAEIDQSITNSLLEIKAFFASTSGKLDEIDDTLSSLENLLNQNFIEENVQKFKRIKNSFNAARSLGNFEHIFSKNFNQIGMLVQSSGKNFVNEELKRIHEEQIALMNIPPTPHMSRTLTKLAVPDSQIAMNIKLCATPPDASVLTHLDDYARHANNVEKYREIISHTRIYVAKLKEQSSQEQPKEKIYTK